ncbi:rtm1 protein [Stemphylium lycopersici]|nr:rtm1 protein [Stemphylium lycopersici]
MSSNPSSSPSPNSSYSIYSHPPPLSAPIVFTTIFAIQIFTTLFRSFCVRGPPSRKATGRKWWFIAVPAAVETVGYALRIASTLNQTSVGLYVSSLVIIVIAPQISAIVAYVVLIAIMVDLDADDLSPVRARHIAPIWLGLDLVAGALQGGGGGQQTNPGSVRAGLILALVGMVMQTLGFLVFSVVACVTLRRLSFTHKWADRRRALVHISIALVTSCVAHNVRFVYRVVEFAWQIATFEPGPYSYAPQIRPVFEYVFDATMMFLAIAVFPSFFYFGELNIPRIRGFEYWMMDREKRQVMHSGQRNDA